MSNKTNGTTRQNGETTEATANSQNGQTKSGSKTKTEQKGKEQEKAKEQEETAQPETSLSLEDRKEEARKMAHLADQHEALLSERANIDALRFGSDRSGDEFTLRDGEGRTFRTSKTDVIEAVREAIRSKIDERIKAVEASFSE